MNKTSLAKRAYLLNLHALSLAEGMRSGTFKSVYRGQGVEFSGVREYLHGDDVRTIDWNVTARMGRPFIKQFEEERELSVFLVVDASFSMDSGSGKQSRFETAFECASLLAMAATQNNSPLGAVVFDGRISFFCPQKTGKDHALMILSRFDHAAQNRISGSVLQTALEGVWKVLKKRTLVVVISDFRTNGWVQPLARLALHHDVLAVRITDVLDKQLPRIGTVPFADPETHFLGLLPTSSASFAQEWREYNHMHVQRWQKDCLRHGAVPLIIGTEHDVAAELGAFFASKEFA